MEVFIYVTFETSKIQVNEIFSYFLRSEKNPISKFSLKSSLIDICEWLFWIHRYLNSSESTLCPLFFFFDKNIFSDLEKSAFYLENKVNFEHFA